MYVAANTNLKFISDKITISKKSKVSLQEQIDDINSTVIYNDSIEYPSIQGVQGQASAKGIIDYSLNTLESSLMSDILGRIAEKNNAHSLINILFITDTHQGGTYLKRGDTSERSIALYKRLQESYRNIEDVKHYHIDVACHGGDISTDYGKGRRSLSELIKYTRDMFGTYNSMVVTKGNHDYNSDEYTEADLTHINWSNNTYYVLDLSEPSKSQRLYNFVEIAENDWDGVTPLFVKETNQNRCISDKSFMKLAQYNSPSSANYDENNPDGAYYYLDYASYKVRVICLNNYMIGDNFVLNDAELVGKQFAWLTDKALNLSDKDSPIRCCFRCRFSEKPSELQG